MDNQDEDYGRYTNHYRCEACDVDWDDTWSCMCNDRCPECNAEIEPYDSDDNREDEDEEEVGAEDGGANESTAVQAA